MSSNIISKNKPLNSIIAKAEHSIITSRNIINRDYLNLLSIPDVLPVAYKDLKQYNMDTRLFKISRIVYDNKNSAIESLNAIYNTLGSAGYSVFLLFEGNGESVDLYIGTTSKPGAGYGDTSGKLLVKSFDGYFPGSKLEPIAVGELKDYLNFDAKYFKNNQVKDNYAITAVSGISSIATEDKDDFMQGIEKFLDASIGRKFSGLVIAEYVEQSQLQQIKLAYENAYTQLSPLLKQQISYGESYSEAISESICNSIGTSLSHNIGSSETVTQSTSHGENNSISDSSSVTKDPAAFFSVAAGIVGTAAVATAAVTAAPFTGGLSLAAGAAGAAGILSATGAAVKGVKGTKTTGTSTTRGTSFTSSESTAYGTNKSETTGSNESTASTDSNTQTSGNSLQTTLDIQNKVIEQMLDKIDSHLERVDLARSFGGWNVASYFIADDETKSKEIAATFLSLTRGQDSNLENHALTTWNGNNPRNRDLVLSWLNNLRHPIIKLPHFEGFESQHVTPATMVTGQELAVQLSLPRKSTSSVTVIEVAPFARQIQCLNEKPLNINVDDTITLGKIRHLWKDTTQDVRLDINNFASHTLITGTTGVGKTNTVISIISQLHANNIPFMVIEPAKGEYNALMGLSKDKNKIQYYSAGKVGDFALKLNPLVFSDGIQLSDHIDRVCNVFNAAFTMYAAMPQVLEEAIYTAYEELGWDSITSTCVYSNPQFPTLRRVADLIPLVVNKLGYSEQTSNDYIGSLSTRIKSLCRGSLGLSLLCSAEDEISSEELFNQSCIIDLSSMGSSDKRALIMGILFMRLNEYRIVRGLSNDAKLKHIAVLEEAHVLLKKTSTDQSMESSNTKGLAIEYFANALAEMRGYGQGFIIADQSASALDDCVLRNTNTKIVMRAPFEQDRIALGGALSLNEDQTLQLSKLENYTAVITQSNWLEPVLCKISQSVKSENQSYLTNQKANNVKDAFKSQLLLFLISQRNDLKLNINIASIIDNNYSLNILTPAVKEICRKYIDSEDRITLPDFRVIVNELLPEISNNLKMLSLSLDGQRNYILATLKKQIDVENIDILNQISIEIIRVNSSVEPQQLLNELKHMEVLK